MACVAHAVERHLVALDDHFARSSYQVAALIDIADDDFWRREDEPVLVTIYLEALHRLKQVGLHLLYLDLLLVDLCQVFLYAVLEFT